MKKKIKSDEIDLLEVIFIIGVNKLKIAAITFIFVAISLIISYFTYNPSLKAKTTILPITIFESSLYEQYNSYIKNLEIERDKQNSINNEQNDKDLNSYNDLNKDKTQILIKKINSNYLLNLFVEELRKQNVIIEAIQNYQLVDEKKYDSEDEYLKAVENKASKLVLISPVDKNRSNWIIEFYVDDSAKWEGALSFIDNQINKNIKNYLKFNFNLNVENLELLSEFKLEDLNLKIINTRNDYDNEIRNQLFFLKEQALIARELNIKNPSFEIENFKSRSSRISSILTETPYYMRGYASIEKEIELIETRTNKDAFNDKLLGLEKQKKILLEDKSLERIKKLFNATPVINGNNFKAAKIVYKETKYEKSSFSLIKVNLIAGIMGIIFGIFYVLILNAIQQRK